MQKKIVFLKKTFFTIAMVICLLGVFACEDTSNKDISTVPEDEIKDDTNNSPENQEISEQDPNLDYVFDDSIKYDYNYCFTIANGKFTEKNIAGNIVYFSEKNNSLYVDTSTPFTYGTISCVLTAGSVDSDSGIIFCVTPGDGNYFQEQTSYYFYFRGSDTAYLGKVDNGSWSALATKTLEEKKVGQEYGRQLHRVLRHVQRVLRLQPHLA